MDAKVQRRVQRYGWDKAATQYEQFWARQIEPAKAALLRHAALQSGERVIDVACGTGLVSFAAAAVVGTGGFVLGTDISDRMVDEAKQRSTVQDGQLRFERMDAEQLDVPDEDFDAALCSLGLMYAPDPLAALREMHRVVKRGGRAVAAVWGARDRCGWAEIFPIVDRRVQSDVCPLFFRLGTRHTLRDEFAAAGFEDIVTERLSTVLHYDSPHDACGAAFAGGPVALAYARFDPQTRDEAHAEYLASIAPYRLGEGYAIPGEFVVVIGRRP